MYPLNSPFDRLIRTKAARWTHLKRDRVSHLMMPKTYPIVLGVNP